MAHTYPGSRSCGLGVKKGNMKEHPILFSTPMVQAILEGRKTQTRRLVKRTALDWLTVHQFVPSFVANKDNDLSPYGYAGDKLWVREKWKPNTIPMGWPAHFYANCDTLNNPDQEKWKPSIHMPRRVCRLELEVMGVRIERLHEITEEDAKAEGAPLHPFEHLPLGFKTHKEGFKNLWHSINGEESWNANPFVWVVTFEKLTL